MIDIVGVGDDLRLFDSDVPKAGNILSIQLRSLEYLSEVGIDLDYFLTESFEFQNESFKSYLVQVLASNGINVASVQETLEALYAQFTFNIDTNETSDSFIAG